MSWSTGFCGHRCVIQEMYHRVSLEIPFSYYLPHVNQQQPGAGRGRRGTQGAPSSNSSTSSSTLTSQQPTITVIQQLFMYLEELIKHYFLHLTLVITADDLAHHSLADIMTLYHRLQLFLVQTRQNLAEADRLAVGYFITLQIPLYPTVTFLQSTIDSVGEGSQSLGGDDNSLASGGDGNQSKLQASSMVSTQPEDESRRMEASQSQSQGQSHADYSMLDTSNYTEKLLEIAFTSFNPTSLKNKLAAKQSAAKVGEPRDPSTAGYNFPDSQRVTPILPHSDSPLDPPDYNKFVPPVVHCVVFDILPENFQYPYPARIMAIQQYVAETLTKTLAPIPEIFIHRTMSSHVNNMSTYATVGGLRTYSTLESQNPTMMMSSVLSAPHAMTAGGIGNGTIGGPSVAIGGEESMTLGVGESSHVFQTDMKNVARNVIQIGTASCQAGDNRGIAYGFTSFNSHDHIDNFIQRNHGKFRIDFIHLNVVELPNIRVNTIEICHRWGINVMISIDDEVFDAVINAEEVDEVENEQEAVERDSKERSGVDESKGEVEGEDYEGEEEEGVGVGEGSWFDRDDDGGSTGNGAIPGRGTLITELDHEVSVPPAPIDNKGFKNDIKFEEDEFFERYEELVTKNKVSLQTLIVKCLHQLGCIVRLKGVLTNANLAISEAQRASVAADSMLRAHYLIKHYGRIVHPFIDRKLFVSEVRIISFEISQEDMEVLSDLSTYEEEAIDRDRAAKYLKHPVPKKLDFAYLGWKGGDESMMSIGVPPVVTFGGNLDEVY